MEQNLQGKRLLLLGGTALMLEVIETAQKMGLWVAVAHYDIGTKDKEMADMAFDVSVTDIDALTALCKKHKIDGVFAPWFEFSLPICLELCERLGCPSLFTKKQLQKFLKKNDFKNTCLAHGVPVPKDYILEDYFNQEEIDRIDFPVIIKPVDNGGAKGITVCFTKEEFVRAVEKALEYSQSGEIIIEDYIQGNDMAISYLVQDGVIAVSSIHDRHVNKKEKGVLKIPDLCVYPSKHKELYLEKVNPLVKAMLEKEGIQNGFIFLQACERDGRIYIYEAGLRFNGCKTYQLETVELGYNALERLIRFAITGNMGSPKIGEVNISPMFQRFYCTIPLQGAPGKIQSIVGMDTVATFPEVISVTTGVTEGSEITEKMQGTLLQLVGRVSFQGNSTDAIVQSANKIYRTIEMCNEAGENLLIIPNDTQLNPAEYSNKRGGCR